MSTTETEFQKITRILRSILISQSEIISENVRNAASLRGEDLDKIISNTQNERSSYEVNDVFLLFEITKPSSSVDVTFDDFDDQITNYFSFDLEMSLYGDSALEVGMKLVSRLRSEKLSDEFHLNGFHLVTCSTPVLTNEFRANTLWKRCDITLELSYKLSYSQTSVDDDVEVFDDFIINTL